MEQVSFGKSFFWGKFFPENFHLGKVSFGERFSRLNPVDDQSLTPNTQIPGWHGSQAQYLPTASIARKFCA